MPKKGIGIGVDDLRSSLPLGSFVGPHLRGDNFVRSANEIVWETTTIRMGAKFENCPDNLAG
jgi:hypothetical protein